jgi:hypothetical protein
MQIKIIYIDYKNISFPKNFKKNTKIEKKLQFYTFKNSKNKNASIFIEKQTVCN